MLFSATSNAYQEQFGKHLDDSLNYLKSISKRIDSLTVSSNRGAGGAPHIAAAEEEIELDFLEAQEKTAYHFYRKNHKALSRDLDSLLDNKRRSIIQTLSFSQLHEREYSIPDAHRLTFEWILNRNRGSEVSFLNWSRKTDGIFWVAGKAGSGKSTLMKFLADHPITHETLVEWADPTGYQRFFAAQHDTHQTLAQWAASSQYQLPFIVVKHYFWSTGTSMQKSQEGLMRSILLQVLSKRPTLVKQVCGERWEAPYADSFYPWTRARLKSAMLLLRKTDVKLCLFIDGLDEYGGDHGDLIELLSQLSQSPNIKLCVSSRPWLDFVDAFDKNPCKIYLQDLTRQDIVSYVTDKLERNDKFRALQSMSRETASQFIQIISKRSEGVFLWVYLVVRSLLRGLQNSDDLRTLRTRLDALPSALEDYFERILLSIEDIYRPRTARLFLTLCYARRSFPVLTFFFFNLDDECNSSTTAPRTQQEPLEFLSTWPDVDTEHFEALLTKKRQLVAQCKDMIHISPDPKAHVLFGERVGFLHRTIVDFIQTDSIFKKLESLAGECFDPRRLLFDAYLGQTSSLIHLHRLTYIRSYLSQWFLGCLFYAYEIEATSPDQYGWIALGLDELENAVLKGFARWDFRHAMVTLLNRDDFVSFLDVAARCDLSAYVKWRYSDAISATLLDKHALGWRSPCRVQRGDISDFEIILQRTDELESWRLGTQLMVTTVPVVGPDEVSTVGDPHSDAKGNSTSPKALPESTPGSKRKRRSRLVMRVAAVFR